MVDFKKSIVLINFIFRVKIEALKTALPNNHGIYQFHRFEYWKFR
jgi:hypothetical protein